MERGSVCSQSKPKQEELPKINNRETTILQEWIQSIEVDCVDTKYGGKQNITNCKDLCEPTSIEKFLNLERSYK